MNKRKKIFILSLVLSCPYTYSKNSESTKQSSFQERIKYFKTSKDSLYQAHLKPIQDKSSSVFRYVLGLISEESKRELKEDEKVSPLVKLDMIDQKILLKKVLDGFGPNKKGDK